MVLLKKSFGDIVHVARHYAGLPKGDEDAQVAASRSAGLRSARSLLRFFPFFRAFIAMEFTLLALLALVLDQDRALVIALVPIAAITAAGHLAAIVTSQRLR